MISTSDSPTEWLSELARLFGPDRLLQRAAQLAAYESDALTAFAQRPAAVVLPESRDEVVSAVKICSLHGVPFVARGSGTSLSGGSLPIAGGLVIALNRLNHILHIDPIERLAVVQPGVVNLVLSEAAAPHGLYYAPDPSSQSVCTIGGNVAFNSGGAHCLKYGMTSNHVLALEVVLPDGVLTRLGALCPESVEPDWCGLFSGSEGLFGIATEITVRLMPRPPVLHTVLVAYDSLAAAGRAVSEIVAGGLLPGALEIMDRLAIDAAEAAVAAGYPPLAAALLIVELEGDGPQVRAEADRLETILAATSPQEIRVARDDAERARIWKGRKCAFSAVGRLSPDYLVQDGVVPRSQLANALTEVQRLSSHYQLRVANVFHAGDGNLHPLILFDGKVPGELERAEELAGEILRMCIRFGGSITGEHGVGVEKRAYLPEMFSPDDMEAMVNLRRLIDPQEIANRGKMFPGDAAPGFAQRSDLPHPLERAGVISRA